MGKKARAEKRKRDLRWLNWYINRGHINLDADEKEIDLFIRSISHRRKF